MSDTMDAILMASGFSKRFGGQNKLLQPFNGKPLACHTLELAANSGLFQNIFFITSEPRVAALGEGFPVTHIHNAQPHRGSCESIRLGVSRSNADYYMFFTCDQPLLSKSVLFRLSEARKKGYIVFPAYNNTPSSPNLFSAGYREALLALQDHQPARIIKDQHPDKLVCVPVQDPFTLFDIDTPADLEKINNHIFSSNQ